MSILRSLDLVLNHPYNQGRKIKTILRILWWKINQKYFKLPVVVEIVPGKKCICYPESPFGGLMVYTKLPEYFEMAFLYNILDENGVFIDVGANMGEMSLLASAKIKKGRVIAFEPSPVAVYRLHENIALNGLSNNVKVVPMVVSNKNGFETFSSGKYSEVDHIVANQKTGKRVVRLRSTRLDTFLKSEKINNVDCLKVDVEGAEMKILEGLGGLLDGRKIGIMILEINKNCVKYGFKPSDIFTYLLARDYIIYSFDTKKQIIKTRNYDGLEFKTFNILALGKKYRKINEAQRIFNLKECKLN
jgi:FkbM family methyltransferase